MPLTDLCLFRRAALFVPLLLAILATSAPAVDFDTAMDGFEDQIDDMMAAWQTPGLAVAVVKDGKLVYAKGFGFRDQEKALEVSPETLFPIGSCTKAFTATALALLASKGKLSLDAPVESYIPWFRMADGYASSNVTARDMLLHRTGLPRYDSLLGVRPDLSRKGLVEVLAHLAPNKPFRYGFEYDNIMYAAAGYLLESVSKKPWDDYVREELLTPIGITPQFTLFSTKGMDDNPMAARPYVVKKNRPERVPYADLDAIGPAGSIVSNALEMAKWVLFNLNNGKAGDVQVVPGAAMADVHQPGIVMTTGKRDPSMPIVAYALGWGVTDYRGRLLLMHDGETDGFHSHISFMPDDGIGVVVLGNRSDGSALPKCAALLIYDLVFGLDPLPWSDKELAGRAAADKEREKRLDALSNAIPSGTSPSHPLADYAGKYENPAYGVLTVEAEGGGLSVELGGEKLSLAHSMYDIFIPEGGDVPETTLRFDVNAAGAVTEVLIPLEPGMPEMAFTRIAETKEKKKKK